MRNSIKAGMNWHKIQEIEHIQHICAVCDRIPEELHENSSNDEVTYM